MISDQKLKLLVNIHVGPFSPVIIRHFKKIFLKDPSGTHDLVKMVLMNFINYKKAKVAIFPITKEIVASLYNTLYLTSEYLLLMQGRVYNEDTRDRFINQVEYAIIVNKKTPVTEEIHDILVQIQHQRDRCLKDGFNLEIHELVLFENNIKKFLRMFSIPTSINSNGNNVE
ncbi:MAG: hypothetical protein ACTSVI_16120 [Promethearchaeota archaeon]